MHSWKLTKLGLQKLHSPKVTKMGSIINYLTTEDCNGVGVLRGQQLEEIDPCNPFPPGQNMPLYNHNLY